MNFKCEANVFINIKLPLLRCITFLRLCVQMSRAQIIASKAS